MHASLGVKLLIGCLNGKKKLKHAVFLYNNKENLECHVLVPTINLLARYTYVPGWLPAHCTPN
jgi:hypothetical protein